MRGYKDFAPDGAFGRSATVSAGPVAASGWAEAVENILRRGFANVLRLIPLCGTQPRSNRNAVAAFSPALERSDHAGCTGKMRTTPVVEVLPRAWRMEFVRQKILSAGNNFPPPLLLIIYRPEIEFDPGR